MSTITVKDGTKLFYKDWGKGQPIVFCHGWPISSDSWESQMFYLVSKGYRCIAHDRRGHGRSDQPSTGNEMDTYADDLAKLLKQLDIKKAVLVGFLTGGGEVTRYIGRHGSKRVTKDDVQIHMDAVREPKRKMVVGLVDAHLANTFEPKLQQQPKKKGKYYAYTSR
jgi:pimeloyl-ACP methyl ester carboxylesterase